MLIPIEEHELLVFWVQLLALVVFARGFGWAFRRIGLPGVIGELLAGVVLGPSVFGKVWPDGFDWFLPHDEVGSAALLAVAWVGIALLLVVTGFETDLGLIKKLGRPAALVTAGSLVVPLVAGLFLGYILPDVFLETGAKRVTFALFVALALSVSSLAVVAKILSEMGLMRRDFGQITVAAGMANDIVGWLLLGVFTGMATSGEISVVEIAQTVGALVLFLGLALTLGQRVVDGSLRRIRGTSSEVMGPLTVAIITMLVFGVITQRLGVEAVLGAFVAGVVLHRSRFQHDQVLHVLEGLTQAFLAPIFFATAGLRIDLGALDNSEALLWTLVIIVVAIVFKFIGAYAGARAAGRGHRAGMALGAGLNARGALEIVIATVGASVGVFNTVAFTAIVLVPVVTSVFASVSLRAIVHGWEGTADEKARLEREEALARNLVVRSSRLLIPSRGGPGSIAVAQILNFAWPPEAAATVLTVDVDDIEIEPLRNVLHGREVEHRRVTKKGVVEAIVAESRLGYGVVGMGVADAEDTGQLISPLADEILAELAIPVVVVRRARNLERPLPAAFSRALVPVAGTPASIAAQEIAFNLSSNLGTEIRLAHVMSQADDDAMLSWLFTRRGPLTRTLEVGERVLEESRALAAEMGVEARTTVRTGTSAAEEIVREVEENDIDLVVLGANLRRLDDRPFLGHKVEYILRNCDATVAVVLVPFQV